MAIEQLWQKTNSSKAAGLIFRRLFSSLAINDASNGKPLTFAVVIDLQVMKLDELLISDFIFLNLIRWLPMIADKGLAIETIVRPLFLTGEEITGKLLPENE